MCPRPYSRRTEFLVLAITLISAIPVWLLSEALAADDAEPLPLQLEVFINDLPTNTIGSFLKFPDHQLAARPAELADLGLKLKATEKAADLVVLSKVANMTYRYDEPGQKIYFTVGDELRTTKVYD